MNVTTRRYSRRDALRRGALLAGSTGLSVAALQCAMETPARAAASGVGRLVAAHLDFGFRLHGALAKATPRGQNLFLSRR